MSIGQAYWEGIKRRAGIMARVLVCLDCEETYEDVEEAFKHARAGCEHSNFPKVYFSFKDPY